MRLSSPDRSNSPEFISRTRKREQFPWLLFLVFDCTWPRPSRTSFPLKSRILIGMLRCVRFLAAVGVRALVAVLGIEAVVHGAVEFVRAVEPRAGAHEDACRETIPGRSSRKERKCKEQNHSSRTGTLAQPWFRRIERATAGAFAVKQMLAAIASATKMMSRFKVVPPPREQVTFRPIFQIDPVSEIDDFVHRIR